MRYRFLSVCITLFWLVMVSSLIHDQILPDRAIRKSSLIEAEALAVNWFNIHEWNWVRMGSKNLGAMVMTVDQLETDEGVMVGSNGYNVIQNGELQVPILRLIAPKIVLKMTMHLDSNFKIDRFVVAVQSRLASFTGAGFFEGKRLFYRVERDGIATLYGYLDLQYPASLLSTMQPVISRHLTLKEGESYSQNVIDPIWGLAHGRATVRVMARETLVIDGETKEAYRLETSFQGMKSNSWVDASKNVLRRELVQGITLDRGSKRAIIKQYPGLQGVLEIGDFDRMEFKVRALEAGPLDLDKFSMGPIQQALSGSN